MDDTLLQGYNSLSKNVNKVRESDQSEGVVSDLLPELSLDMKDDELISLKRDWIKQWEPFSKEMELKNKSSEDYWLGKQATLGDDRKNPVDNLIFEALETFLPIATRPKADPVVESDNTEAGISLANKTQKMLSYVAENKISYNLKVREVVRYWALYRLGVMKVGWSVKKNDITCLAIRPQKLILDPRATITEAEYDGYYIGEHLQDSASDLIIRFPKKENFIKDKVIQKMGTTLEYIMWTTDDYVFWTMDDEVLDKAKNPHWNYDVKQPAPTDEMGQQPMDENGQPQMQTIPAKNHFSNRKKPYIFLTYFNLGKQPHDDTSLIEQNISLQDLINKRLVQIDKNADNANGGMLVSGDAYTEEQSSRLGKALRKGGIGWVPTGNPSDVVMNLTGAQLPQFVYQSLTDYRNELRNIFGTRGSAPQGTINEKTVRGKVITKGQDVDRIGGGITRNLEQFSSYAFNWFVQLMYVYYDEPHFASVLGKERTQEYIQLVNTEFTTNLSVGVKEGSMIPQDPATKREEAMTLWAEKAIDPITFFDRLEFPNPRESAKNLYLWLSDPIALFPDLQQAAQANAKPPEKPPNVTINYSDVEDPSAKAQMLAKIDVKVDPQAIAQGQQSKELEKTRQMVHEHQLGIVSKVHDHKLSSISAEQNAKLSAKKPNEQTK
jgi:hypothetical protein